MAQPMNQPMGRYAPHGTPRELWHTAIHTTGTSYGAHDTGHGTHVNHYAIGKPMASTIVKAMRGTHLSMGLPMAQHTGRIKPYGTTHGTVHGMFSVP